MMVDFDREFIARSINKVIYFVTMGLEYREEVEDNEVIFIFQKSEESKEINDKYKRMLQGEEITVNLTRYMQVSREINGKVREYRKR
ncbi:DUF5659 domain-containing protein [Clostridium sp.]|uniref:DUF5659 domain-containing protein n=1 Tax=Clostridium sp. TaxID=1506 RepID=UPI00321681CE